MDVIKTITAATAVALATLASTTAAGSVTLFSDINFSGESLHVEDVSLSRCYLIDCFNDRASSATWSGLPEWGYFDGHAVIAFYTDTNCGGDRRIWYTNEPNKPSNFVIDGINDAVSSFKLIQHDDDLKARKVNACYRPRTEDAVATNTTAATVATGSTAN